jgi:hypothetical protein
MWRPDPHSPPQTRATATPPVVQFRRSRTITTPAHRAGGAPLTPLTTGKRRATATTSDAAILHLTQPVSLTPDMTKPPAPKGGQRLHRVGARLAPLGKWPLEAAFLGWYPGQRTEHRQSLQRRLSQSYSTLPTSAVAHFRVMIVRNTKRNTTAVPNATTATTSADPDGGRPVSEVV